VADASDVTGNNKKREEEGGGGGAALRLDCVGSRARQRKSQGRERGEQHGERPRPTDRAAAGTLPEWLAGVVLTRPGRRPCWGPQDRGGVGEEGNQRRRRGPGVSGSLLRLRLSGRRGAVCFCFPPTASRRDYFGDGDAGGGGTLPGGGHLVSDLSVPPPLPPFFVVLVRPPDFRRRVNQGRRSRSLAGEDRSIIVLVSDLGDARARRAGCGCRCRW
jgi:hypothetical protein